MDPKKTASPIAKSDALLPVRERSNLAPSVRSEEIPVYRSPYVTVAQFSARNEAFPENSVRAHIAAAVPRLRSSGSAQHDEIPANGLAPAILRIGRRVLLHEQRFMRWVETGSCECDGDSA